MRAIIFGANGQDGRYLRDLLINYNVEVTCISRNGPFVNGDIASFEFVKKIISNVIPDYIFHLAAKSSTDHKFIFENYRTICDGTNNILECAKDICPRVRIFIAGSALQFENNGAPINEASAFMPSSVYAAARISSVMMSRYFREKFNLKIYVGYLFNHDSIYRSEDHINQKIVQTVKRIALGSREKLVIGDLTVRKEFNYAGDIVTAIWALVNQDYKYEAVIGSGKAYSIQDWVDICFQIANTDSVEYISSKNGYKSDFQTLVSDPSLILSIGWKPKVNIDQLAEMMYNDII